MFLLIKSFPLYKFKAIKENASFNVTSATPAKGIPIVCLRKILNDMIRCVDPMKN